MKDQTAAMLPPTPESVVGKGSPMTSSTQGCPSPLLPLAAGILVHCRLTGLHSSVSTETGGTLKK